MKFNLILKCVCVSEDLAQAFSHAKQMPYPQPKRLKNLRNE